MRSIAIEEASAILGVSIGTLRRWEREGQFVSSFRTQGGHRRYALAKVLEKAGGSVAVETGKTVCYARVSSHDFFALRAPRGRGRVAGNTTEEVH